MLCATLAPTRLTTYKCITAMADKATIPSRLAKQPVVDVVFEVRFSAKQPVSTILPGALFGALSSPSLGKIEPLPAAQIPPEVRAQEEELRYAPLVRIYWGNYFIAVGDTVLAVACSDPYPGWSKFSESVFSVFSVLEKTNIINSIERCSIKYLDLFEHISDYVEAQAQLNLTLNVGNNKDQKLLTVLRTELLRDPHVHALQWASRANVRSLTGPARSGAILEIDTILKSPPNNPNEFFGQLKEIANSLHGANKDVFFEMLSEEGLKRLEPEYD